MGVIRSRPFVESPADQATRPPIVDRLVLRLALVFIASFGALMAIAPEPAASLDSTREEALTAAPGWLWTGIASSMGGGVSHGALYHHYLEATRAVGLGPQGQYVGLAALTAVAAALVYLLVGRAMGRPRLAWPSAALFVVLTNFTIDRPDTCNKSLSPLFGVLFYLAYERLVRTWSTRTAIACGAALALASASEITYFLLTPIPILLALLATPLRAGAAVAFVAAEGVVLAIDSPTSALGNVSIALQRGGSHAPLIVLATAMAAVSIVLVRRHFRRAGAAHRPFLHTLVWTTILFVGIFEILAIVLDLPREFGAMERLPLTVPLSIFLAVGAERASEWPGSRLIRSAGRLLPSTLFGLLFIVGASAARRSTLDPQFSLSDTARLHDQFRRQGIDVCRSADRLRGPASPFLAWSLRSLARCESGSAPDDPRQPAIRIARVPRSAALPFGLPPATVSIPLVARDRLIVSPIDAWVDASPEQVCFEPISTAETIRRRCFSRRSATDGEGGQQPGSESGSPGLQAVTEYAREYLDEDHVRFETGWGDRRARFVFYLPVQITGSDPSRVFQLTGFEEDWQIDRVEGVGYRGSLPGRRIEIDRSGATTGRIAASVVMRKWGWWHATRTIDFVDVLESGPGEELFANLPSEPSKGLLSRLSRWVGDEPLRAIADAGPPR